MVLWFDSRNSTVCTQKLTVGQFSLAHGARKTEKVMKKLKRKMDILKRNGNKSSLSQS